MKRVGIRSCFLISLLMFAAGVSAQAQGSFETNLEIAAAVNHRGVAALGPQNFADAITFSRGGPFTARLRERIRESRRSALSNWTIPGGYHRVRKSHYAASGSFQDYNKLGVIYAAAGRNEDAVKWLRRAVELQPDYASKHYNLGCVYIRLNSFKEAVRHLELAVKLDPNNIEIRFNLGYAYAKQKRYRSAIAEMEKVVRVAPEDEQAQMHLCSFYLLANDKESARVQIEATAPTNPGLKQKLYRIFSGDKVVSISSLR